MRSRATELFTLSFGITNTNIFQCNNKKLLFRSFSNVSKFGSVDFPVGILGGGPVGFLLSNLLTQYEVPHCLIERRLEPTHHPQAHFINNRSMEIIYSHFPSLFNSVINSMPQPKFWKEFVYCYSLIDKAPFARVDHFKHQPESYWGASPTTVAHLAQNRFEKLLIKERMLQMKKCKADDFINDKFSPDSLFLGYEAKHLVQDSTSVKLKLHKVNSNNHWTGVEAEAETLKFNYLIAADGANSFVRSKMG